MITCETPDRMWTVEGKIEVVHEGAADLASTHVGIKDLSHLLSKHVEKWAKVRVELIEGPSAEARREDLRSVAQELERMRSMAMKIRKRIAAVRVARVPANVMTLEEHSIEMLAETMLVVCNQLEGFDRRLQNLEGR